MQLISKFSNGFRLLLRVIDICSKYASIIPVKGKKWATISNAIQKVLNYSGQNRNKTWVDNGREFYNRSIKSCEKK